MAPDLSNGIAVDAAGKRSLPRVVTVNWPISIPARRLFNLCSAGQDDVFISKLDATGSFAWAVSMGGISDDHGYGIALDTSGNVYSAGDFWHTVDFDPGPENRDLSSAGESDVFLAKFDTAGGLTWATQLGGTSFECGRGVAVDTSDRVYATGSFQGTADFDPGPATFALASEGACDIFISELTQAEALDFGDAPAPFATTLAEDGARHKASGPDSGSQSRY